MKKTLLLSAMILLAAIALNAQTTKIWNLGGDPTVATNGAPAFAISSGIGTGDGSAGNPAFPVVINGLAITGIAGNVNMGAVNAQTAKTFTDANSVSYSFPNRFQFNGGGYGSAAATDATPLVNMPTQRFVSFQVSGNSKIYAIGITGTNSTAKAIFVTTGTAFVGKIDFPVTTGAVNDGAVNYTGPATTLYVFCNASCNLYYLSATNVVSTAVSTVLADKGISFNGTEISNTKNIPVEVYNVLGKKVASSSASIATTNFVKGVYIVRVAGASDSLKISI
jgi:hypothetical protein